MSKLYFALFLSFSSTSQALVLLETKYDPKTSTYRVWVDQRKNNLSLEPVIQNLKIDLSSLPNRIPAELLLSDYAKKWAYKNSETDGPNCWHTSIAVLFNNWTKPRQMPSEEFLCHLENSFEEIEALENWGDLIRLNFPDGMETHGFTFLGVDRKDPSKIITFTKNGSTRSPFVFMDLDKVREEWSFDDERYYRAKSVPIDPSTDANAVCAGFN